MPKTIKINKEITDHLSKNPDFILQKDDKWDLVTRLSKSSGHLSSIKTMIYQDEDPKIIMSQFLAIKGAISAIEKRYINSYLSLAKTKLIENNDETYLNNVKDLVDIYLK